MDTNSDDLKVINVGDPTNPSLSNSLSLGSLPFSVAVSGNYAYVVDLVSRDLKVIGLSCPSNLTINPLSGELKSEDAAWEELGNDIYNINSGNVGIGTTNPGSLLQVGENGDGSVARANAWNTFSDSTLKRDFVELEDPLSLISQINGYTYYWKDGAEDTTRQVGVMAQEVQQVLPELVSEDSEGVLSVDYGKLTALLIEVNQAQESRIEAQQTEIEALQAQVDALRSLQSEQAHLATELAELKALLTAQP